MSGRRQAVTVALLFGLIPMLNVLSGAIVALVTLRKGLKEGLLVMLWALLPAALQWKIGDTEPVFMVLGVTLLATVLRHTQSWPKTLLAATVLGVLLQLSLVVQQDYVANVQRVIEQLMAGGQNLQIATDGQTTQATPEQVAEFWLDFYGVGHMMVITGCLLLGRAWQAMLYNPGGFRQEFHNLRMDPKLMAVWFALVLGGMLGLPLLADWMLVFCVVPALVGLAVVHHVVASRKLGASVLVMGYMVALLLTPVIIVLGFADSVLDVRKRLAKSE
jgi:hypothetical protein